MIQLNSPQSKWREIFERQQLANVERYLNLLIEEDNPNDIIIEEYDNLLRALEVTLLKKERFDLAYRLIELLFPIVFGYADWDRWLIYLNEAIVLSQELNREVEEVNLLNHVGDIFVFKGNYQKARELYGHSGEKCEQLGDKANYASTLAKLASVYDLQGNMKESLALLEEASRVANSLNDLSVLMQVNVALSSAYHKSREWHRGLAAAQSAYDLADQLGNYQTELIALLNMVACHTELGNWHVVEALSPKLEEALTASGDLIKLSQFKNNMGIAAFTQGDYYVAENAWQDALRINSQVNQPIELARVYNNLGMVYTKLGEFETAIAMLKQAATIFEDKGDMYNWANTLDNLAEVYEILGDEVQFRSTLNLALSLLPPDSVEVHVQGLVSIINGRLAITA